MNHRFLSAAINGLCLALLAGVSLYLIAAWSDIPEQIPGHYDAAGEVNRWSGRGELIFLSALGWVMYIGMTVIEHFPGLWNTGVKVTEQNREQVYRALRTLLATQKLWVVATITYLTYNAALSRQLSVWFLPAFLVLGLGSLAICLLWLFRIGRGTA